MKIVSALLCIILLVGASDIPEPKNNNSDLSRRSPISEANTGGLELNRRSQTPQPNTGGGLLCSQTPQGNTGNGVPRVNGPGRNNGWELARRNIGGGLLNRRSQTQAPRVNEEPRRYVRSDFALEANEIVLSALTIGGVLCSLGQVLFLQTLQGSGTNGIQGSGSGASTPSPSQTQVLGNIETQELLNRFLRLCLGIGVPGFLYVFSRLILKMLPPSIRSYNQICSFIDEGVIVPCGLAILIALTVMLSLEFALVAGAIMFLIWVSRVLLLLNGFTR